MLCCLTMAPATGLPTVFQPAAMLKIDQSFVSNMMIDAGDKATGLIDRLRPLSAR